METRNCTEHKVLDALEWSIDRFRQAHWFIHQMEIHYHDGDRFRYCLNAFLSSIKEIPSLIKMQTQNKKDAEVFRDQADKIASDAVYKFLKEKRDFVVHRGMLELKSKMFIGCMEGKGFKLSFSPEVPFWVDSDEIYEWYIERCQQDKDMRSLFGIDEDSFVAVERRWLIPDFEDELLEVAKDAWKKTGRELTVLTEYLGGEKLDFSLSCALGEDVGIKAYGQKDYFKRVLDVDLE